MCFPYVRNDAVGVFSGFPDFTCFRLWLECSNLNRCFSAYVCMMGSIVPEVGWL